MTPPAEGSRLERRTLNRTLLARQDLLACVERPIPDEIERLVGLQAQVPRDPYISLWSRLRGFDPAGLEGLLLDRDAVRMTLMRTTLHLVTATDARVLRAVMQDVCERGLRSSPFQRLIEGVDLSALLTAGAAAIEEQPRTMSELGTILAERWPGFDRSALAYAVRYLVPVVQVTPRGLLRRSAAPRVTTLAAWLGPMEAPLPNGDDMLDEVVLRYLRAFGPATVSDIRTWSWLRDLRPVVDRLRPRLRGYVDERGRELLDVEDGIFAEADAPAPVRFLGEYDNIFLAHADRSRITGDDAWGAAYIRKGAFFVDGFLAGSWTASVVDGRAVLQLEARSALAAARDEVAAEGEGLLGLLHPDATSREVAVVAQ